MASYKDTVDFLFSQTPMFQKIGAAAYKPGLDTVRSLAAAFGNPERQLRCIHVAGTNGKGSTAHSIASVLQEAGFKVGLFTSPHLVDFRERIKINGEMIEEQEVVDFVEKFRRTAAAELKPSFFELTTMMAFDWFARNKVDYAVIEVGLGGRLDSTNIITPLLSVITNISFDHVAQLGNTLEKIASEKAGIIKPDIPVVIGEDCGVKDVFLKKAVAEKAPIRFADAEKPAKEIHYDADCNYLTANAEEFGTVHFELTGDCQHKNLNTILTAIDQLRREGIRIPVEAVQRGLAQVVENTGLMGRWMQVCDSPRVICDTGHNIGGWELISGQLSRQKGPLFMVIGFVNDKDISHILPLMPRDARYFFTRASVPRALPAEALASKAEEFGLHGAIYQTVSEAVDAAIAAAKASNTAANSSTAISAAANNPLVYVGGSTFVVADLFHYLKGNGL